VFAEASCNRDSHTHALRRRGSVPRETAIAQFSRMRFRVLVKIDIVQVSGEVPEIGIGIPFSSVAFHRSRDHQRVIPLVIVPHMAFEEEIGVAA